MDFKALSSSTRARVTFVVWALSNPSRKSYRIQATNILSRVVIFAVRSIRFVQKTLSDQSKKIKAVAFHPSLPLLASGGGWSCGDAEFGEARIYNTDTFAILKILKVGDLISLAFHATLPLFAIADPEEGIHIYNTSDWTRIQTLKSHSDDVRCVVFHQTLPLLASGSHDSEVHIYSTSDWTLKKKLQDHPGYWIHSVDFHSKLPLFAMGTDDSKVHIYNFTDWSLLRTLNHSSPVRSVVFHPTLPLFASGASGTSVHIYNLADWSLVKTLADHKHAIAFHPKLPMMAAGFDGPETRFYDTRDWTVAKTITNKCGGFGDSLCFHDLSPLLAHGFDDGKQVRVFNVTRF